MIALETAGEVAILRLANGDANPLTLALVEELADRLHDLKLDDGVRAVVLGSAGKLFSLGWNLPELIHLDEDGFRAFYRGFDAATLALYMFPKPLVAAVEGHAVAGGCILVLACDRRVVAEGRTLMGLNEVKLGVPVPYTGDLILRAAVPPAVAREIMEAGEFHAADRLLEMGVVDEVRPRAEVTEAAVALARGLGASPAGAFRAIKENRVDPVVAESVARWEEKEQQFLDCWFSPETRPLLAAAADKFR